MIIYAGTIEAAYMAPYGCTVWSAHRMECVSILYGVTHH